MPYEKEKACLTYYFTLFSYPRAIEILSEGHIAVDALITHHFSLEQSQEAFDTASTLESRSIKVMIHCNPEK